MADGSGASDNVTVRQRLEAERSRLFVGRREELAGLAALLTPSSEPLVAYVYGPGGIGKTELLRALQRQARERGCASVWIDASAIPVNPVGLRAAFDGALAELGEVVPSQASDPGGLPRLVLIDAVEYLAPLSAWIWSTFMPDLPAELRVVLAGRERPPVEVEADPAWRRVMRVVGLGNLGRLESLAYLEGRGVPAGQRERIFERTFGHPLALALAGEMAVQGAAALPRGGESHEVVAGLLAQLLRKVPSPRHQVALWGLTIVRNLTEDVLRAMLEATGAPRAGLEASAATLYQWLQGLSFVRLERRGLAPHDLIRELLAADLAWRDPVTERRLAVAAMELLFGLMERAREEMPKLAAEIGFIIGGRSQLIQRGGAGEYAPEPLQRPDWPTVLEMAERHEGPSSAACVRYWLEHGGEAYAIRGLDDRLAGFAVFLALEGVGPPEVQADPAVAALSQHLRDIGAAEARVLYIRSWMAADTYKDLSAVQAAVSIFSIVVILRHLPDLVVLCEHTPEDVLVRTPPGIMARLPAGDFVLDGHRYGTIAIDFRGEAHSAWVRRYMLAILGGPVMAAGPGLARSQFDRALRDALRAFDRADLLAKSPLLACSWVETAPEGTAADTVRGLQQAIRQQVEMFLGSAKDVVYYKVISATYLEPRVKQLEAAATLGLPYGSYRRHLDTAVRRLADALWQRQTG